MTVPFISSGKPLEAVTAGPISLMTPREKVITVVAIAAVAAGVALSIVAPPLTALFVVGVVLASGGAIGVVARAVSIYCRIHRMESLLQEVTQALKDNPDKSPIKTAARALDMSPLVLAWIIKRGAPTTLAAAAEVERGSVEWVAAQLSTTVEALKVALIDVSIYKNCLAKECHKEEFNEKVTRQLMFEWFLRAIVEALSREEGGDAIEIAARAIRVHPDVLRYQIVTPIRENDLPGNGVVERAAHRLRTTVDGLTEALFGVLNYELTWSHRETSAKDHVRDVLRGQAETGIITVPKDTIHFLERQLGIPENVLYRVITCEMKKGERDSYGTFYQSAVEELKAAADSSSAAAADVKTEKSLLKVAVLATVRALFLQEVVRLARKGLCEREAQRLKRSR